MIDSILPVSTSSRAVFVLPCIALFLGCAGSSEEALCEQAAQHVEDCLGLVPLIDDECSGERAQAILDKDCDGLQQIAEGKSDEPGWCVFSPFPLFEICPDTYCARGGSLFDSRCQIDPAVAGEVLIDDHTVSVGSGASDLWVSLKTCGSFFGSPDCSTINGGVPCTAIELLDANGGLVASGYSSGSGSLHFVDLATGGYQVRVLDREGQVLQAYGQIVGTPFVVPAQSEVQVSAQGARLDFAFATERHEDFKDVAPAKDSVNCVRLEASVSASCEGQALQGVEAMYAWLFKLARLDDQGNELGVLGYARSIDELLRFHSVLPGSYAIVPIEMDIPAHKIDEDGRFEGLFPSAEVIVELARGPFARRRAVDEAIAIEVSESDVVFAVENEGAHPQSAVFELSCSAE